jgi:hypothetical protein
LEFRLRFSGQRVAPQFIGGELKYSVGNKCRRYFGSGM